MTVKTVITQTCNRCGQTRDLNNPNEEEHGGWRKVKSNKHICASCIDAVIKD